METSADPLEGKKTKASWVAAVFKTRSANAVRIVRKGFVAALYFMVRLSFSYVDIKLSRKGMPPQLRWSIAKILAIPTLVVHLAIVGMLVAMWVVKISQVTIRTERTSSNVESKPNKKRTPQKHRLVTRFDDFSDVRARIRELSK